MFGCSDKKSEEPPIDIQFAELSPEDSARLETQRALVAAAIRKRYGPHTLTKTKADLAIIQRLVDDKVFANTQTDELQALGVVFGDVLANELGLRWVMVTDAYGTDPVLRYKETSIQLGALTMISKRVEEGREVELEQLLKAISQHVKNMIQSGEYK